MNLLRLKHKLTAYHFRRNRRGSCKIAICSCGWRPRFLRPTLRDRACEFVCGLRGHQWEPEPFDMGVGPACAPDEDFDWIQMRQCERCLHCEEVPANLDA